MTRDIIIKGAFEKLMSEAGISPADTVIVYGDNNNWFAAYGLWLFKIYGHKDVRLMNGGRAKWLNENDKELASIKPTITPTNYTVTKVDCNSSPPAVSAVFGGISYVRSSAFRRSYTGPRERGTPNMVPSRQGVNCYGRFNAARETA